MAFYQNPFNEYLGNYIVGDSRAFTLTFKVAQNRNHGEFFICWNTGPYDLSGNTVLTLNYASDNDFKNWNSLEFDFGMVGILTAFEIVDALNADTTFAQFYTASVYKNSQVGIRQKKPAIEFRTYISNTGAEKILKFNKFAGLADIPSYFEKDTIENRFNTPTANNQLIRLGKYFTNTLDDPTVVNCPNHGLQNGDTIYIANSNSTPSLDGTNIITYIDADSFSIGVNVTAAGTTGEFFTEEEYDLLTDAGLDYATVLQDYEHLQGRAPAFEFTKNTIDGSDRITQQIIYTAGSTAGMLGRKILMTYDGANLTPSTVIKLPYVLTSSDLMSP